MQRLRVPRCVSIAPIHSELVVASVASKFSLTFPDPRLPFHVTKSIHLYLPGFHPEKYGLLINIHGQGRRTYQVESANAYARKKAEFLHPEFIHVSLNINISDDELILPSAFLLVATVIVAFMVMMGESPTPSEEYTKYTTVTGYFLQDDDATDPKTFDFTTSNFGLKVRSYPADADLSANSKLTQWQRFAREVSKLNHDSSSKVTYKLLYLGRHGEGYHNVAEAFYGTEAWDCYWSLQDGNETSTWVDALLTPVGEGQAQKANSFWRTQIKDQKMPTPETYYTSPLLRCMATASITFSGLDLPKDHPFIPTIKESIREVIGVHTCDRRSSKSIIHGHYPDWPFEEGFAEEDPLWSATLRETNEAIDQRTLSAVEDLFATDKSTYISISAHSGQIASMLRVLDHRVFGLGTGQAIPVLVKAERVPGFVPPKEDAPWETVSTCSKPPPAPTA